MDEKEKKEAEEKAVEEAKAKEAASGTDDTKDGVQQKTISELDRADQIAERQKRENDRREELLTREEALAARKAVGGVAEAGQSAPAQTEEDKKKTQASEFFKDTALGDAIDKVK